MARPGHISRRLAWLRTALALGALATAAILTGCSGEDPTPMPDSAGRVVPPLPQIALEALTPVATPTVAPILTRTPPPTPPPADDAESPSEIETNSLSGVGNYNGIEQVFVCENAPDADDSSSSNWYFVPRADHVAGLLGDGRVVFAGGTSVSGHDLWPNRGIDIFDPRTETWCSARLAEGHPRFASAVVLEDGRILIVGIEPTTDIEDPNAVGILFDPVTGRFSEIAPPGVTRKRPKLAPLDDGRVVSLGGVSAIGSEEDSDPTFLTDVEIYDPAVDMWTGARSLSEMLAKPRNLTALSSAQLFDPENYSLLPMGNNRVLLFHSGYDDNFIGHNRIEIYDANNDSWNIIEEFAPGSGDPAWNLTLTSQDKLYMFYWHWVEIFDLTSGEWELNYSPRILPEGASVTELQDGRLLLAGGKIPARRYGANTTARVEIFDPKTKIWTAGTELPESRAYHTATLLQNGDVLLYGGNLLTFLTLPSIYPPDTMTRLISSQDLERIATDLSATPEPPPFGNTDFPCQQASPPALLPVVPQVPDGPPDPGEVIGDSNDAMKALGSVAATVTLWHNGGEQQENLMLTYQRYCFTAYVEWETPDWFFVRHSAWEGRGPYSIGSDVVLGGEIHSLSYWYEGSSRETEEFPEFFAGYLRSALADQQLADLDWEEWITLAIERGNPDIRWKDVAIESLDGTDVYHLIGTLERPDGATVTTNFWIGVEDSFIRRIYSQGSVLDRYSLSGIRQVYELWEFNGFSQEFGIQAPELEE